MMTVETDDLEREFYIRVADASRQRKPKNEHSTAGKPEPIDSFSIRYAGADQAALGNEKNNGLEPLNASTLAEAKALAFLGLRELPQNIKNIEIYQGDRLICSTQFNRKDGRWGEWTTHYDHVDDVKFSQFDKDHTFIENLARDEDFARRAYLNMRDAPPPRMIQKPKLFGLKKNQVPNPQFGLWKKELMEKKDSFAGTYGFCNMMRSGVIKRVAEVRKQETENKPVDSQKKIKDAPSTINQPKVTITRPKMHA